MNLNLLQIKENYITLFILENLLRKHVNNYHNRKSDELYYHELIPLLNKNLFTKDEKTKLYKLNNIRNKIAHMNIITTEEEIFLKECYLIVNNKNID